VRLALLFILVCVFHFLSPLVRFFLWLPEEVLALLFLLHRENGDFSILMKDILYRINNLQSNKELALPVYVTQLGNDTSLSSYAKEMKLIIRILLKLE
jgi:hypothetical protein